MTSNSSWREAKTANRRHPLFCYCFSLNNYHLMSKTSSNENNKDVCDKQQIKPKIAFSSAGDNNKTSTHCNNIISNYTSRIGLRRIRSVSIALLLASWLIIQLTNVSSIEIKTNPFRIEGLDRILKKLSPFHNIYPDAYVDPPQFIASRRFVPEVHHVVTKDNYILTIHRIINPLVPNHLRDKLKPILLQHGLFTSSFNFLIGSDINSDRPRFDKRDLTRTRELNPFSRHPYWSWASILEHINDYIFAKLGITQSSDYQHAPHVSQSLAFELANQGYDVWMCNSRGSTYSLNHTTLNPKLDWRYWDFSFHEIALYDLPASIEYVLEKRQRKSLSYIGHSQGNLIMFILQSSHPEWAERVKPFVAMAPIGFIPDVYFGGMRALILALQTVGITPRSLNDRIKGQLLPKSDATAGALDTVCVPKATAPICDLILSLGLGDNFKRANHSLTGVIAHHIPEGTSILNVLHFGQMIVTGEFRSFNFGPRENLRRYGTPVNPFYPIKNIYSRDIAFIQGATDTLATIKNVAITKSMLRVPLMDEYIVPDVVWGHSDYMYANGAGRLVNAHMIGLCDRYRLVP